MRQRGPFALVALATVLYASLVVAAALPDQTWVSSVYDAADDDHVLLLVWDTSGVPQIAPSLSPPALLFGAEGATLPQAALGASVARVSRAPPRVRFTA